MSLINQVLKDLDKRGAGAQIGESTVRVVHARSGIKTIWLVAAGAAGMLVIAVASWMVWQAQHQVVVTRPPVITVPAVAILPASQPVAALVQKSVPGIVGVSPEPVMATGAAQTIIINGKNFEEGSTVNLYEEGGAVYPERPIVSLSPVQIVLKLNFGRQSQIWMLEVTGKNGATSGKYTIATKAPATSVVAKAKQVAAPLPLAESPPVARTKTVKAPVTHNTPGAVMADGVSKQPTQISMQQQADNEFRRAYQLMREGRNSEALTGFAAALKLDAGHELARQTMVGLLLEKKNNAEAEHVLQEGLKNNIKQNNFAMLLARLQVERNAVPQAYETLMNTLPYAENQPDYLAFVAALLQRQNRHQDAIDYYGKALQLKPQSGVWLMGMGISLRADKQNAKAQDAFRRALESNTLSAELRSFVSQQLKEL